MGLLSPRRERHFGSVLERILHTADGILHFARGLLGLALGLGLLVARHLADAFLDAPFA